MTKTSGERSCNMFPDHVLVCGLILTTSHQAQRVNKTVFSRRAAGRFIVSIYTAKDFFFSAWEKRPCTDTARLLLNTAGCHKGRCFNSQQELCFFSYPGLVDWSLERSAMTSPSALISSKIKLHQRVSMQQDTHQYASASKTGTTLPACITISIVHHCTLRTYSVLQMAKGPIALGCMNHSWCLPMPPQLCSLSQSQIKSTQMCRRARHTRGHLNPSMHQKTKKTKEDREATFTLTNIVPQLKGSNTGTWNGLEGEVLKRFKDFCKGSMYVITGAMPYKSGAHKIKNRVSVPEYMWSAYCCPSYSTSLPQSMKPLFPTYAVVGRNDRNSGQEIVPVDPNVNPNVQGYDVRQMPLKTLEDILAQRLGMPEISLFKGKCQ